jgi:hypothetical protein
MNINLGGIIVTVAISALVLGTLVGVNVVPWLVSVTGVPFYLLIIPVVTLIIGIIIGMSTKGY